MVMHLLLFRTFVYAFACILCLAAQGLPIGAALSLPSLIICPIAFFNLGRLKHREIDFRIGLMASFFPSLVNYVFTYAFDLSTDPISIAAMLTACPLLIILTAPLIIEGKRITRLDAVAFMLLLVGLSVINYSPNVGLQLIRDNIAYIGLALSASMILACYTNYMKTQGDINQETIMTLPFLTFAFFMAAHLLLEPADYQFVERKTSWLTIVVIGILIVLAQMGWEKVIRHYSTLVVSISMATSFTLGFYTIALYTGKSVTTNLVLGSIVIGLSIIVPSFGERRQ